MSKKLINRIGEKYGYLIILSHSLLTQRTCPISCGNCRKFKNGCRISNPQMAIFKILNKGVLNFKSKSGYNIDIALVDNGRKIAIEYDCFVWHSKDRDDKKTNKLVEDGWNVLRIKSAEKIPTIEQINLELLKLNSSNRLSVITLDDWEEREVYRR